MKLLAMSEAMMRQNMAPVLMTSPEIRRHLRTYTRRAVPRLSVISMTEVPTTIELRSFGVVDLRDSSVQHDFKEAA
jgi:flagellar biosynthesis protein FlhA